MRRPLDEGGLKKKSVEVCGISRFLIWQISTHKLGELNCCKLLPTKSVTRQFSKVLETEALDDLDVGFFF